MDYQEWLQEGVLLDMQDWPAFIQDSEHGDVLKGAVEFSKELETRTRVDTRDDERLHRFLVELSSIALSVPQPEQGSPPAYLSEPWDLRALIRLVPKGLEFALEQAAPPDEDDDRRWTVSLSEPLPDGSKLHPSQVPVNHFLNYDTELNSEAWTPNLALARILLAAYMLAVIFRIWPQPISTGALGA